MTASERRSRLLGCLLAAYVFLGPGAANAFASAASAGSVASADSIAPADSAASTATRAVADQNCRQSALPPSRAAARGTLPDTGSGRSLPPLFAAAGLLAGGVAFRLVAARMRRREIAP